MVGAVKSATLDEIVERLKAAYEPERIYIFGSRARGEGGLDSDHDILSRKHLMASLSAIVSDEGRLLYAA
jgi:predicted nucleotidyltransferase